MSYVISLAVDGECKKEPDPETGKLTLPVLKLFKFGKLLLAKKGERNSKVNFSKVDNYMKKNLIEIEVNLNLGHDSAIVYGNDLNNEYIKINADYRS